MCSPLLPVAFLDQFCFRQGCLQRHGRRESTTDGKRDGWEGMTRKEKDVHHGWKRDDHGWNPRMEWDMAQAPLACGFGWIPPMGGRAGCSLDPQRGARAARRLRPRIPALPR